MKSNFPTNSLAASFYLSPITSTPSTFYPSVSQHPHPPGRLPSVSRSFSEMPISCVSWNNASKPSFQEIAKKSLKRCSLKPCDDIDHQTVKKAERNHLTCLKWLTFPIPFPYNKLLSHVNTKITKKKHPGHKCTVWMSELSLRSMQSIHHYINVILCIYCTCYNFILLNISKLPIKLSAIIM